MDGMVGLVARRDDVMAQICELVSPSDAAGANAFVPIVLRPARRRRPRALWTPTSSPAPRSSTGSSAQRRAPRRGARARVHARPHGHTAVDIVNDDMPFLVDSLTMALDRHDLGVHLVVHPILGVRRTADGELRGMYVGDATGPDRRARSCSSRGCTSRSTARRRRHPRRGPRRAARGAGRRARRDPRLAADARRLAARRVRARADARRRAPTTSSPRARRCCEWLADQHFTFLGYREYRLDGRRRARRPCPAAGSASCATRRKCRRSSFAALPPAIRAKAREKTLLVLTKANARSTVHRPTHLDYVGVKRYDAHGKVIGEHRFLGLYTSAAYTAARSTSRCCGARSRPFIERAGFLPASHDQKDLVQILETYPRDDLFQIDVDHLFDIAMGILRLQERRRVRLFVHREPYGRFVSCLVFVPRDRYTTRVRGHIAELLVDAFGSQSYEWNTRLSDSVLARLHYVLHLESPGGETGRRRRARAQVAAAARAWVDDLRDALVASRRRGDRPRRAARVGRRVPCRVSGRLRRDRGARRLSRARAARRGQAARRRGSRAAATTSTSSSTASARSRRSPRCCRASRTWA